jgi:Cytochrome c7 and related cytochrome c
MPQIFHPAMNTVSKASVFGSLFGVAFVLWVSIVYTRSSYGTDAGVVRLQPVPFSHEHHVGGLGIDCRYCHTSVEHSSFAGLPPTKTCMNCHSQIWVGSTVLEPVRQSYRTNESLRWNRVYNVPGFVYFDHSIHVQKGVGCASCHGRIDEMPFTYQVPSLLMEWCLDCHRHPESHLRPRAEVFNMKWSPSDVRDDQQQPLDQLTLGRRLVQEYGIKDSQTLTSCSVCHR